jgi:Xaa-Pro aminopeptidase
MENLFESPKYTNRRMLLRQKLDGGIILLPGNNHSPYNYSSNVYPFRQDSSFSYFFGLNSPSLVGILDVDSGFDYLFSPEHTTNDLIWEGPVEQFNDRASKVGIRKTGTLNECTQFISDARNQKRMIHFLPAYRSETVLWLMEILHFSAQQVKSNVSVKLILSVAALRTFKDNDEVYEIENTLNSVTSQIHIKAMQMAQPGIKEHEIAAMAGNLGFEYGSRPAYPIICTINGQYLHNESYGNTLKNDRLLLLDAGIESKMNYATDITRTFPIGKQFTTQQKEIYVLVMKMMDTAFSLMKPGISYALVHQKVSEILAQGLLSLNMMKGNPEEIVQSGAHALFFPHGLGHLLGLDVHDMENLGENHVGYDEHHIRSEQFGARFLRYGKKLQEGIVITVEPGIYFIPDLIHLWKSENRFEQFIQYNNLSKYFEFGGIRVEDNVLVTDSGCRVLGNPIPKSVNEIESIRSIF